MCLVAPNLAPLKVPVAPSLVAASLVAPAQRKDIEDYLLGKTARPAVQYMREGQARWPLGELAAAGSPGKGVAAAAGAAADRRKETLEKIAKRLRR